MGPALDLMILGLVPGCLFLAVPGRWSWSWPLNFFSIHSKWMCINDGLSCSIPLRYNLQKILSPSHLALTFFQSPLSLCFLSSEERDLMEIYHLGLSVPRSHTMCNVRLWVYMFLSMFWRRKPLSGQGTAL